MLHRKLLQKIVVLFLLAASGFGCYLVLRLQSSHRLRSQVFAYYNQVFLWNQLHRTIDDFLLGTPLKSPTAGASTAVLLDSIVAMEWSPLRPDSIHSIDFHPLRALLVQVPLPIRSDRAGTAQGRSPKAVFLDSLKTAAATVDRAMTERQQMLVAQSERIDHDVVMLTWIVLVLMSGMGVVLALTWYRSEATVRQFQVATMQYAQGNFDYRMTERGTAEIREVIELFNAMGDQLQELERLKAEFFSKLVHDFKSPLDNIKQSADVLLGSIADGSLTPQQKEFLNIIKRSATHLRALAQEQLDESRLLTGQTELKYERIDLKPLILDRIQLQKPAAKARRITFSIKSTDADFGVDGDRSKLTRVIDNLLSNAIKYTRESSTITVELDDRLEGMVEFRIRDQGPGIPEPLQEKIFHKYVRLVHSGKTAGTGLGLFTAKYIVELHRGQIWVKSAPPDGATFHVLLPKRLA